MIDWFYVAFQASWITGMSICLAVISIAIYSASQMKSTVKDIFRTKEYMFVIDLGVFIFCAGLCGLARVWWEGLLWGLLGSGFIFDIIWNKIEKSADRNRTRSD
jgi:hypothetical protein